MQFQFKNTKNLTIPLSSFQ